MTLPDIRFSGLLTPEDPRWVQALAQVPHDFFHLPGYVKAAAPQDGGDPRLYLLDAGTHGMLVPLIKRPLKAFGEAFEAYHDATSPYGYPAPLYWGEDVLDLLPEFHARFEACLREEKIVTLFLRLNPSLPPPAEALAPLGEVKTHGPTVYLDLRDAAASWSGINSGNRRAITRLVEQGYDVRMDQWDTLDQVCEAYEETMRRLDASPYYFFPREFFLRLKEDTAPHFHLATSYDLEGHVTGGVFFSEVGGLMQYFLTGTFPEFSAISPGKLLINALRLWGLEHGHHTLHLGGGLGAKQDSVYDFKIRLSKCTASFSSFRKVLLPEICTALSGGDEGTDGFFPPYRRPRPHA